MQNDAANPQNTQENRTLPKEVTDFVFKKTTMNMETEAVKGYDFNNGIDYVQIIKALSTTGLQSTNVSQAIDVINKMISWRLSDDPYNPMTESGPLSNIDLRKSIKCTVFLGYNSSLVSSGVREAIRFLVEHKLVNCIVTSGAGIEEDLIKCLGSIHVGNGQVDDVKLREQGVNRLENILIPNDNYSKLQEWVLPIFDEMYEEQKSKSVTWTPSKVIRRLGEKIDNPESIYYWAAKNEIPVFCTGFAEGALGDMLFMHSYQKKGFIVDIVKDIRKLNKIALKAKKSGVVILGGGAVKDYILKSNIMKNGADYAVSISSGNEYNVLQEALSWGKLKADCKYVSVCSEASLVFPIIMAESFAKYHHEVLKAQEARVLEAAQGNSNEHQANP